MRLHATAREKKKSRFNFRKWADVATLHPTAGDEMSTDESDASSANSEAGASTETSSFGSDSVPDDGNDSELEMHNFQDPQVRTSHCIKMLEALISTFPSAVEQ
jgi:hypothetical protein